MQHRAGAAVTKVAGSPDGGVLAVRVARTSRDAWRALARGAITGSRRRLMRAWTVPSRARRAARRRTTMVPPLRPLAQPWCAPGLRVPAQSCLNRATGKPAMRAKFYFRFFFPKPLAEEG